MIPKSGTVFDKIMRATDRSLDVVAFVSEHFRDILRRRLSEIAGLALITLALLGAIALATWSVQDPSLSHATQKPIHNLLGFPGAIFSDLAMQLLGLAAILLLLPEALLGWRLLAHKPIGEKWRGLVWIVATFLAAGFASTLPRIGSWPLPTGLGGVSGDALLHCRLDCWARRCRGLTLIVLSAMFGIATVVTLAIAAGLRWPYERRQAAVAERDEVEDEDADDDRASAWKGMIVHALLSWKARIGRLLRGAPPRAPMRTAMPAPAGARQEPRFDGLGRVAAPAADERRATRTKRNPRRAAARRRGAPAAASRCPRSIC